MYTYVRTKAQALPDGGGSEDEIIRIQIGHIHIQQTHGIAVAVIDRHMIALLDHLAIDQVIEVADPGDTGKIQLFRIV